MIFWIAIIAFSLHLNILIILNRYRCGFHAEILVVFFVS